jgi:hypothetical protein
VGDFDFGSGLFSLSVNERTDGALNTAHPRQRNSVASGRSVAIYRLLENSAFDPERIKMMVDAYECACRALDLVGNKTDPVTEIVARKIVEIAQTGLTDSQIICERSLEELGITRH